MAEEVPPLAPDFEDYDKLQAELAALDLSQAPYVFEWPTPQRHQIGISSCMSCAARPESHTGAMPNACMVLAT